MTSPCDYSRDLELEKLLESDPEEEEDTNDFVPVKASLGKLNAFFEKEEDTNDLVPVKASLDKFNASFEKDQEFWRKACETLDENEYEKLVRDYRKKEKYFDKFDEIFRQQSEFWTNASDTLDEDSFEKLVEEECGLKPFSQSVQMDIDFQPFLDLFNKSDNFWKVAKKPPADF